MNKKNKITKRVTFGPLNNNKEIDDPIKGVVQNYFYGNGADFIVFYLDSPHDSKVNVLAYTGRSIEFLELKRNNQNNWLINISVRILQRNEANALEFDDSQEKKLELQARTLINESFENSIVFFVINGFVFQTAFIYHENSIHALIIWKQNNIFAIRENKSILSDFNGKPII